jgi:glycosyltransferase involved in cell wall biosynthesis
MDVTVIIPTRNRSALLSMTLRSVLRQQDVDLEVVVVDEASTDDTRAVIAAFGDPRVRVIRHARPVGVSAARNRGADEARAEWLSFVDDDDLWAPDKLALQLRAAREANVDWAYSGAVVIDHHERFVRADYPLPAVSVRGALLRYYAIPGGGSNILVRRARWEQAGPFNSRMSTTEDWDMCIRLAKGGAAACVYRPSVARRIHATNSTLDISEVVRGTKLLEAVHEIRVDWGRLHRWMAHSSLRGGRRRAALGQFAKAALHGQSVAVVSDLSAILRARVAARFPQAATRDRHPDDPWRVDASRWIAELRGEAACDAAPGHK